MKTKICTKCGIEKDLSEFHKDKAKKCGYCSQCKLCRYIKQLEWFKRNPHYTKNYMEKYHKLNKNQDKLRASEARQLNKDKYHIKDRKGHLKYLYNITLEQYIELLKKQNYICAICKKEEVKKNKKGVYYKLAVDHDHKTGKVRGLLCYKCNNAIGLFKEDIKNLKRAIAYLKGEEKCIG